MDKNKFLQSFMQRLDELVGNIDQNRRMLAEFAAEARDAGVAEYAEIIGRRARRSPSRVRHWAAVADISRDLIKAYGLRWEDMNFSMWEAASAASESVDRAFLISQIEAARDNPEITVEEFRASLNDWKDANLDPVAQAGRKIKNLRRQVTRVGETYGMPRAARECIEIAADALDDALAKIEQAQAVGSVA